MKPVSCSQNTELSSTKMASTHQVACYVANYVNIMSFGYVDIGAKPLADESPCEKKWKIAVQQTLSNGVISVEVHKQNSN